MSLKYDKIEYLLLNKDIADAVEDLKNGKRNSKSNLYKFVHFRRMSKEDYKKIVERYYKVNIRNKKYEVYLWGHPIKEYIPILFLFSVIVTISIILFAIDKPNLWVQCSAIYLLISFLLYHYSITTTTKQKDNEIAGLKQEIRKLEDIRKSKELEKARNHSIKSSIN